MEGTVKIEIEISADCAKRLEAISKLTSREPQAVIVDLIDNGFQDLFEHLMAEALANGTGIKN